VILVQYVSDALTGIYALQKIICHFVEKNGKVWEKVDIAVTFEVLATHN